MNPADFIHVLPENDNVLGSCLGDVISLMSTSKGRSWGSIVASTVLMSARNPSGFGSDYLTSVRWFTGGGHLESLLRFNVPKQAQQ